jgi:phosphate transport system permease protein
MTDTTLSGVRSLDLHSDAAKARVKARYRAEARFRFFGLAAIGITVLFLAVVLADIVRKSTPAFTQHVLRLTVTLDPAEIDPKGTRDSSDIRSADFHALVRNALRAEFPEVKDRAGRRELDRILSSGAADDLRDRVVADPGLVGRTVTVPVLLSSDADLYFKGLGTRIQRTGGAGIATWLDRLKGKGLVESRFNWRFFTSGDSREPELAGIRGALVGSALTLFVTLALCVPLGVAGAIYLEEFAPKNRFTEIIEVNINNLAAVPSIVFGLLGLAVFLNFFGLPRSAPVVGGLVLALLVLPTIIIASRAALRAVPPSIKEAALGVGASHQQAVFHHVLPLAMPGIMTGTIIGMAHALGETAPLLMIGMVAFIVETPSSITDAATVLPVQIYLWSDLPEAGFQAKTAAAIMVLLVFLFVMNGAAIILRRQFERRW